MAGFIDLLRTGAWLTRERVRLVAALVLAAFLIGAVILLFGAQGLSDSSGRPLGTDFSSFYAAGTLVHDGLAAQAFDRVAHFARERAIFGPEARYYAFQYPPVFLLVAAAMALLPYLLSLAVWQAATFVFYLLTVRAILKMSSWPGLSRPSTTFLENEKQDVDARDKPGHDGERVSAAPDRLWLLLAIAFPAVFINLGHGQNGFLTVALFGGALALLDRRPIIAGMLIGLMIYKPQFGLMIPLVLLATGRWRVIFSATATIAALLLFTFIALGPDVWPSFRDSMTITRVVLLEEGDIGWFKIQSVFSWVRLWGGPVGLAYAVQGIVTLAVAAALVWFWRSDARYPLKAAALLIGTLLATPFCLDYDLMLLAPAIAFLGIDGLRHGFCYWHKTVMALLWLVPLVSRSIPEIITIPVATPLMLAAFVFVLQRAISESRGSAPAPTGVN
ncbi:MAG: glycosyltransferase family 87 protein [Pseudolabrys sp.]|nr:glycosyltransferase family 87 protein [Pseudolabrys sp.]